MLQVRTATNADRAGIRALWKLCFGDTEPFMDWFFSERYFPEYSACLLEDGAVMSAMQGCPMHIRLRGETVLALMLAGVSTHPERGGRGYMRQCFAHFMQIARRAGISTVIHTPAHMPTFFSRGHYQATNTLMLTFDEARAERMPPGIAMQDIYHDLAPLHICYTLATSRYSGCVSRSLADFYYKFRDYAADGAEVFLCMDGTCARGYCVYYAMDDNLHAEECIARDAGAYALLIDALRHRANGRKLTVKLPPDVAQQPFPGGIYTIKEQGAMGIADVSAFLRAVCGDEAFLFEVHDKTVPENQGVFDGAGRPAAKKPHIVLEAGRLGQFFGGYRSMASLWEDGLADVRDERMAALLDMRYPTKTCFVVEEY